MRTIYDIDTNMREKEKMGSENVVIFLQVVKKYSPLYTKKQVEEIEKVITYFAMLSPTLAKSKIN